MPDFRQAAFVDFETLPIRNRPDYPPPPVGVAISLPGVKSKYMAWAHPTGGNNCTWQEARAALGNVYDSGRDICYHKAKFDQDVSTDHMDLPRLPWQRVHDTMPMLFLRDPRAPNYQLKPSAERILGDPPDERDAVLDWLIERQPIPGKKLSKARGENYAGAYTAYAPVDIVDPYAIGDVDRTKCLAIKAYRELRERRMVEPYDRERRLLPHIMDMERQGLRLDVRRLARDVQRYTTAFEQVEKYLCHRMNIKDGSINFNSSVELVGVLVKAQLADVVLLGVTATGKVQTNKDALEKGIVDPTVLAYIRYRAQLKTCLGTFMRPWLATAERSNGFIYTTWHSTRTDRGKKGAGARTGRLSSTPNFMNIPKAFAPLFFSDEAQALPRRALGALVPPLPLARSYIVPYDGGDVLVDRDYNQQELRILGHFEQDVLCSQYNKDPWLDVHAFAGVLINEMLKADFGREAIKRTGFGLVYGMGLGALAESTGISMDMARKVKAAYLAIFPNIKDMYTDMRRRAKNGEPIRTWGGREYYCEPPKIVDGRLRTYDYKLVNVLIQGSAADCTKEAIIRYMEQKPKHHRLLLTVHDQLTVSAPRKEMHEAMEQLRVAMESVQFRVPMLSEGKWSPENWNKLRTYDKKGKRVTRAN